MITGPQPAVPLATAAPAVPPALGAMVDRLLSKDLAQRPASAQSVRDELLPLLATCPRLAPVPPPDDPGDDRGAPAPRISQPIGHADTQASDDATTPWHESSEHHDHRRAAADVPTAALGARATDTAPVPLVERLGASSADARGGGGGLFARPVVLVAIAAVVAAVVAAVALRGHGPVGPREGGGGGAGAEHPVGTGRGPAALGSHADLDAFVRTWNSTIRGSRGAADVSRFYAESVQFGGSAQPSTRDAIHRYWQALFRSDGDFDVDADQSTWLELPATLNAGVSPACVNLPFATGRVLRVRAHATDLRPDRSRDVGCPRLEGVYFLDVRRANGALVICHEAWSMHEGICASCPSAPACANGGAQRP
jgi:hypothetical protein